MLGHRMHARANTAILTARGGSSHSIGVDMQGSCAPIDIHGFKKCHWLQSPALETRTEGNTNCGARAV